MDEVKIATHWHEAENKVPNFIGIFENPESILVVYKKETGVKYCYSEDDYYSTKCTHWGTVSRDYGALSENIIPPNTSNGISIDPDAVIIDDKIPEPEDYLASIKLPWIKDREPSELDFDLDGQFMYWQMAEAPNKSGSINYCSIGTWQKLRPEFKKFGFLPGNYFQKPDESERLLECFSCGEIMETNYSPATEKNWLDCPACEQRSPNFNIPQDARTWLFQITDSLEKLDQ